jgi:hypothetical protein
LYWLFFSFLSSSICQNEEADAPIYGHGLHGIVPALVGTSGHKKNQVSTPDRFNGFAPSMLWLCGTMYGIWGIS